MHRQDKGTSHIHNSTERGGALIGRLVGLQLKQAHYLFAGTPGMSASKPRLCASKAAGPHMILPTCTYQFHACLRSYQVNNSLLDTHAKYFSFVTGRCYQVR